MGAAEYILDLYPPGEERHCSMIKALMILFLLFRFLPGSFGADTAVVQSPAPAYSPEHAAKIVRRAYQKELGRAPDRSGMANYHPLIESGERDEAWLRGVLRASDENKPRLEEMQREHRMRALGAMLKYTAVWGAILAILWAFGDGAGRMLLPAPRGRLTPFQKMVLGFAAVVAVLQPVSLLTPLNGIVLCAFLACGVLAIILSLLHRRRKAESVLAQRPGRVRLASFALLVLAMVVIAAAASARRNVEAYDSLLYHLSTVRWLNEYPTVPGLANLHIRLGTNSAWLLFAGLLDNGPLDGRTAWFMPGLMCLLFLFYLLHILFFAGAEEKKVRILAALLLPFGLVQLVSLAPSLYFDLPAHNLLAVCLIELVRRLDRPRPEREPGGLLMLSLPAALSFVIKPIGAPFLALAGILTLLGYIQCLRGGGRDWRNHTLPLFPAVILIGWMLRNAVLSGWLLFPAQGLRLPVDWAVPAEPVGSDHVEAIQTVKGQREIIQAFSRRPGQDYAKVVREPLGEWLPRWARERSLSLELRWLLPLGLFGLLVGALVRPGRHSAWPWLAAGLLIAGNLAFWLHNAPDLRYGTGLFWMWFAYGGTLALDAFPDRTAWRVAALTLELTAGLAIIHEHLRPLPEVVRHSPWIIGQAGALPTIPQSVANGQTPSLILHTPARGDQCGDAELPCTPYPRASLLMREPGELRSGFRVVE